MSHFALNFKSCHCHHGVAFALVMVLSLPSQCCLHIGCGFIVAIIVSPLSSHCHSVTFVVTLLQCCLRHRIIIVLLLLWCCLHHCIVMVSLSWVHHHHFIVVPLLSHHCSFIIAIVVLPSLLHCRGVHRHFIIAIM